MGSGLIKLIYRISLSGFINVIKAALIREADWDCPLLGR